MYKICEYEHHKIKICCESLNNCPSIYRVDNNLENLKSSLLSDPSACSKNPQSLMSFIQGLQTDTCKLGAGNCKVLCENRLLTFKRRLKSCFSIRISLDRALHQARNEDSACHKELIELSKRYKRQSVNGESELREKLSAQDIVDCEGLKDEMSLAVGTRKVMEVCNQASQEIENKRLAQERAK